MTRVMTHVAKSVREIFNKITRKLWSPQKWTIAWRNHLTVSDKRRTTLQTRIL